MNIKPGKWRSECGECVIVEFYSQTGYWIGYRMKNGIIWSAPLLWSVMGSCYPAETGNKEEKYNLIEPWTDKPVVNWAAMPAWAKWVAMDGNLKWSWYTDKPDRYDFLFARGKGLFGLIPTEHCPSFTGNWSDSLVERPAA